MPRWLKRRTAYAEANQEAAAEAGAVGMRVTPRRHSARRPSDEAAVAERFAAEAAAAASPAPPPPPPPTAPVPEVVAVPIPVRHAAPAPSAAPASATTRPPPAGAVLRGRRAAGDILMEEAVEAATEAASKAEAAGAGSPGAVLRARRAERTAIRSVMEQLIKSQASEVPAPAPAQAGALSAATEQSLAERFGSGGAADTGERLEAWRQEADWDGEDGGGDGAAGPARLEAYERQIEAEAVYEASRCAASIGDDRGCYHRRGRFPRFDRGRDAR